MRIFAARWLRIALLVASVAALAAELVELAVINDSQIAKLAQQFGPIARQHLNGWKRILTDPKYKTLSEREKLERKVLHAAGARLRHAGAAGAVVPPRRRAER